MSRFVVACMYSIFLLSVFGCHHPTNTQARYYDDGRIKPVVALIPIFDSSNQQLEWNLSEELTQAIQNKLAQRDKIYLSDQQKVHATLKKIDRTHNPFSMNLNWMKKSFSGQDFVVFMELIEHDEVPLYNQKTDDVQNSPAELNLSLRLRILDLRYETPRIILQEIIHDKHYVPKQFTKANFHQEPWGKSSFSISPIGLAHGQLTKEVVARIEDYILLAKGSP